MNSDPPNDDPAAEARLRSGTAARLAGLPVTTLRVWERRYGVVVAPKSPTGQRLYSQRDVQRLKLLKQLTAQGHAIGTIATLPHDALQNLFVATQEPARPAEPFTTVRGVVVVGRLTAQKLAGVPGHAVIAMHDDLALAATMSAPASPVDVLLVDVPSLQPGSAEQVMTLAARLRARAVVVLYAFCTEAVSASLRAAGATLRRAPVSGPELAQLIGATTRVAAPAAVGEAAPRRFSDDALAALAELRSGVACECPRHLAEIVTQLAHFERYSADCLSRNDDDAELHRHLSGLAGVTRTMFEQALERVVTEEGLDVPRGPGPSIGDGTARGPIKA